MDAYQFKPGTGQLVQQEDGKYVMSFELAAYQGQTFNYVMQGINAENYLVIDVDVEGSETGPVAYHHGQTPQFERGIETGVELVAKKDGKRKGSISDNFD